MKQFRIFAFILISLALPLLFLSTRLNADVGIIGMPGGALTTTDKTDAVEMTEETVTMEMKKGSIPNHKQATQSGWHASVTAVFHLKNTTASEVPLKLTFPFPSVYPLPAQRYDEATDSTTNIKVFVNDTLTPHKLASHKYDYNKYGGGMQDLASADFDVKFPANRTTTVKVQYDTNLENEPKQSSVAILYIMGTGSNWKGSIGKGTVSINFPSEITQNLFKDIGKFRIDGNKLVWNFTDLEPTSSDDIGLAFYPLALTLWGEKSASLKSITSSSTATEVNSYILKNNPKAPDLPFMLESSPVFLTDKTDPLKLKYHEVGGWIADLKKDPAPWVQFEFDASYKVSSVKLFTGRNVPNFPTDSDLTVEEPNYRLMNRPKSLELTFSDGETKSIPLPDTPDKWMTVEFDEVTTSSVKATLKDFYTEGTKIQQYANVTRMEFPLGEKVAQEPVDDGTTDKQTAGILDILKKNLLAVAIGGAGVAVVAVVVVVKIIQAKSKPKSPN